MHVEHGGYRVEEVFPRRDVVIDKSLGQFGLIALRAGDKANGRMFLEQARDSYDQCIAAGTADPGDQFLQRQIIAVTCARDQPNVLQTLQKLQ